MTHMLKGFGVVIGMALVLYLGWAQYKEFLTRGQKPPEGTQLLNKMEKEGAPDFSIQDLKGQTITLSEFKNKIVIVNFWASWCEPCVKEFPSLIQLLKQFPDDLVLLAISADYTLEDLNGFTKAFGVENVPNFIVMWDKDQKVAEKYGT
ncbi:MAG: TlpA family protein disulfide reductase, partial [Bdellovibrionales bacterium]|nr:TlpA family protein disulfide reductase [Bdellovibrionales bacterium]